MAPNPRLTVLKIIHRVEQLRESLPNKKAGKQYTWETTPIPGIYGIDEKGQRYLIAMKPISCHQDVDNIFAPKPERSYSLQSWATASSDSSDGSAPPVRRFRRRQSKQDITAEEMFPRYEGAQQIDFEMCRYLKRALPVEFNPVLDRWMFTEEMQYRLVSVDIPVNNKLQTGEFLRLDEFNSYMLMAIQRNGKTKIRKGHGIGQWWGYYHGIGMERMSREVEIPMRGLVNARELPEFMAGKKGDDDFMKVVRYLRGTNITASN